MRMPLCLCNAPATKQSFGHEWTGALVELAQITMGYVPRVFGRCSHIWRCLPHDAAMTADDICCFGVQI